MPNVEKFTTFLKYIFVYVMNIVSILNTTWIIQTCVLSRYQLKFSSCDYSIMINSCALMTQWSKFLWESDKKGIWIWSAVLFGYWVTGWP